MDLLDSEPFRLRHHDVISDIRAITSDSSFYFSMILEFSMILFILHYCMSFYIYILHHLVWIFIIIYMTYYYTIWHDFGNFIWFYLMWFYLFYIIIVYQFILLFYILV